MSMSSWWCWPCSLLVGPSYSLDSWCHQKKSVSQISRQKKILKKTHIGHELMVLKVKKKLSLIILNPRRQYCDPSQGNKLLPGLWPSRSYSVFTGLWVLESKSRSVVSDSLGPHGLILQARILEWVAVPFSRGSSQTEGLNPGLPHCRRILYQLSHQRSPRILQWVAYPFSRGSSWPRNRIVVSCIAGRFFTSLATREALEVSEVLFLLLIALLSEYQLQMEGGRSWRAVHLVRYQRN